jgi:hypothetical protein
MFANDSELDKRTVRRAELGKERGVQRSTRSFKICSSSDTAFALPCRIIFLTVALANEGWRDCEGLVHNARVFTSVRAYSS